MNAIFKNHSSKGSQLDPNSIGLSTLQTQKKKPKTIKFKKNIMLLLINNKLEGLLSMNETSQILITISIFNETSTVQLNTNTEANEHASFT